MTFQYVCFIIFAILAYLIITDQSVARAFILVLGILRFQYEKYRWIALYHPKTPWAQYIMWRRSMKLAKELEKEFGDGNRNS